MGIWYVHMQPIAFHVFGFPIHWYGLMYLIGFVLAYGLCLIRIRQPHWQCLSRVELDDYVWVIMLGVIIGGRLGEVLLYEPVYYWQHPLEILKIWHGGMSYHGGLIGVLIGLGIQTRRYGRSLFFLTDFIAPMVQIVYALVRIGNFINAELLGRPTQGDWGVVFTQVDDVVRYPSQLYQASIDGVLLFVLLWLYSRHPRDLGKVSALYLIGYALARFCTEYFRTPDFEVHWGPLSLSSGQLYSIPMCLLGLVIWYWAVYRARAATITSH